MGALSQKRAHTEVFKLFLCVRFSQEANFNHINIYLVLNFEKDPCTDKGA